MFSRSLLLVGALLSAQAVVASDNITIRYLEPLDAKEAQALKEIQQSGVNDTMVALSERLMPFNKPLVIEYGSDDGPLYDPQKHVVQMPYTFYQEAWSYFKKNKYDEKYGKSAELGAIDTILHTLIHEAGHAYIADQNIPILGKEEDAVDNLAALLMIDYVDNGDDAAISAADMFAFESGDKPDYYEFGEYIDEHSFDLQRYFSTLCLVYGSDPEKHKQLLDEVEKDYLTERKDFCIYQYQSVSQNWHHYLQSTSTDQ